MTTLNKNEIIGYLVDNDFCVTDKICVFCSTLTDGWNAFCPRCRDYTKLDLELALLTKAEVKMLCFKCHVEIPRGNVCVNHKNVRGAVYFE